MNLDEIYFEVLNRFGDLICRPDLICQNSNRGESEYKHTVRWTLQDGKKKFGFYSDGKGNWSKK